MIVCCEGNQVVEGVGFDVCSCARDIYACEYDDYFRTKKVAICTMHQDDDSTAGYHLHTDCIDVDDLNSSAIPGSATNKGREIYKCGCCPTDSVNDNDGYSTTVIDGHSVVVKNADNDYCTIDNCYNIDDNDPVSVCDEKDSKVEICYTKLDGSDPKEKCEDPFWTPGKGNIRSNCGKCPSSRRKKRRMRSRPHKGA